MIRGRIVLDKKTKNLVKRIKPHEIAVIDHQDLDQIASESLVEKKVKAVINNSPSISGKYPNYGPQILLGAGIPVIDVRNFDLFSVCNEGDELVYNKDFIYKNNKRLCSCNQLDNEMISKKIKTARENLDKELGKFIDNTLNYAWYEKDLVLNLYVPETKVQIKDKQVLIVVRGVDYKNDLDAIKSYLKEIKPVIIAVDGGADACLEQGYKPDIIIGDMDSVSDRALLKAKEIIVHAYPDGNAPGLSRIKKLGLEYILFPAPGTSEDIAMLLAYEKGAELITALGTHSHIIDFFEKGRPGMASTLLVRLKIGSKLVDAKGVSKLYKNYTHYLYWIQVFLAVLLPLSLIGFFSVPLRQLLELIALKLSIIFNF